jgi:CRISPR-associated protein Csb1
MNGRCSSNAGCDLDASKETKPMPENTKNTITAAEALKGESPLVLVARLAPVADLDRFQPAGFPEVGHVIYRAPRPQADRDGQDRFWEEHVCIVDSAASMANHLESICMRGAHDPDLVEDLATMPYIRCVTGDPEDGKLPPEKREVVVTSLTEGHRIASTYFLAGEHIKSDRLTESQVKTLRDEAKAAKAEATKLDGDNQKTERAAKEQVAKEKVEQARELEVAATFQASLVREFGIALADSKKAHPPPEKWWNVFKTVFRYDPNALVHGVLFPQWQIKIPRVLTAHLEAIGASRVDRSGVKFDRLGKTTSGQPIFAVDDATAREIRATFILDLALVRSFGRQDGDKTLGLTDKQKEFLVAFALWKVQRLLASPFRFRSGCHLRCVSIKGSDGDVDLNAGIRDAIEQAGFTAPPVTDVYWPRDELYRESKEDTGTAEDNEGEQDNEEEAEAKAEA